MKSTIVLTYLLLCLFVCSANAQPSSLGARAGYQHVFNTTNLNVFRGMEDCGQFSNGNSPGYYFAITGEYALLGDLLEASIGLGLSHRPAYLEQVSDDNYEVLDPESNSYVPFQRLRTFNSGLTYVAVDIGVRCRPLREYPVFARVAFDAGNPVVSASYDQTEQILSPAAVLFPDGRKVRSIGEGSFATMGTAYGVAGFIGGVFAATKNIEVCPEIGYRYGINSIIDGEIWKQNMLTVGVQVRYRLFDEQPVKIDTPPPPPVMEPVVAETIPVVESPLTLATITTKPLEIRETIVTQTYPLLPYLFFDSASTALPVKYIHTGKTQKFSESDLPKQTLPIYYKILDIVGNRLMAQPQANLVITGTSDGKEGTSSEQRIRIAEARANQVKAILVKEWGIDPKRLTVKTIEKPTNPTSDKSPEGLQENRRVELSSASASILAPVIHSRFNEYVPEQPDHVFGVKVLKPELASSWNLEVTRENKALWNKSGSQVPPSKVTFTLNQDLTERLGPVITDTDYLRADLTVQQKDGTSVNAGTMFPIHKTISNFEVSRLSLIVFDFDQYGITDLNREMMNKVVSASSASGSVATIIGSTDRMGELAYNQTLSESRARAVEQHLLSTAPNVSISSVQGVGPSALMYDNNLPEGRFYCRTVSLTITTPLDRK